MSRTEQDERVAKQAREQIAYSQGADAVRNGKKLDDNPHVEAGCFQAWRLGWTHTEAGAE